MLVAALQAPPPHTVPAGYLRQPPAPSQVPSVAQLAGRLGQAHAPGVRAAGGDQAAAPGLRAGGARAAGAGAGLVAADPVAADAAGALAGGAARLAQPLGAAAAAHAGGRLAAAVRRRVWQLPVQAPLVHWNGAQFTVPPALQVPSPSQRLAATSAAVAGAARPAGRWFRAGTCEQAPRPSQRPLEPQPAAPVSAQRPIGSLVPAGTGWQLPSDPGRRQLKQASSQRVLQQVPPTQWALWQSTSWVQLAPSSRGPHEPATHITPDTQPAPSWQLGLQRGAPSATLQANGAQGTAGPATQLPAPSQDDPAVMLLPEQTPAPQRTPAGVLAAGAAPVAGAVEAAGLGRLHAAAVVVAALGGVRAGALAAGDVAGPAQAIARAGAADAVDAEAAAALVVRRCRWRRWGDRCR